MTSTELALASTLRTSPEVGPHRVLQRTAPEGRWLQIDGSRLPAGSTVHLRGPNGQLATEPCALGPSGGRMWLPTGGPYDLEVEHEGTTTSVAADLFVGDLWILAGQSNIEGCGRIVGAEQPVGSVRVLDMTGRWRVAREPLHMKWLSPYRVHNDLQEERDREALDRVPEKRAVAYMDQQIDAADPLVDGFSMGAGPGVAFGNELAARRGVPVGLLPCAHGGSSMAQWSPQLPDDGSSLFGAMMSTVRVAGGEVAGVLWYQGESECDTNRPYTYDAELTELFSAIRSRIGVEDLAVLAVQLGRYTLPDRDVAFDLIWSRVRESQRTCSAATAVTTAVDLDLDDPIHIGTVGQRRLGRRLARLAAGIPGVDLEGARVTRDGLAVEVTFSGAVGQLHALGDRVAGFSIRSLEGADLGLVFRVDPLPAGNGFRLRLARRVELGDQLWYGFGADPHCNVVDGDDMAPPAFGPVQLIPG